MKQLLLDLLRIESVSGATAEIREAMELLADHAEDHGLETEWHEDPLYCIVGRGDLHHPSVGVLCHLDVVPPFIRPSVDGDRIYGRGAIDMKGPALAVLEAVIESDHPSVAVAFTGDEETTGSTAAYLSTTFIPDQVLLVPDQNRDFNITKESKGLIEFSAAVSGDSAHGSTPWAGKNAVEHAHAFYEELCTVLQVDNGLGWSNTLNLSFINAPNDAYNVIPAEATAGFDFRFQSEDGLYWQERIRDTAEEYGAELEFRTVGDRLAVDVTERLELFMDTVQNVTGEQPGLLKNTSSCDARFYPDLVRTIIVTKCAGGLSHSDDEYVEYDSLEDMKTITRRYLETLRERDTV